MAIEFCASDGPSLGIEIEFALVDTATEDLSCCAGEVLAEMGEGHPGGEHPFAKQELYQSTIEVITGINATVKDARADLTTTIDEVRAHLDPRGVALACSGVHPFARWYELDVSPSDRYAQLLDTIQWPARRLMTDGVHFHVGVRSGEKAVAITNALMTYLPHFIALTASSPFWHGHDTGLASVRSKIWETLPKAGIPPQLADWAEFETFMATLIRAGSIETVRDVWWDVRPHPDFGTVELRMCDGIPTLQETLAVAALAQSLVHAFDQLLDEDESLPVPRDWIIRENKWRAARFGLEAEVVVDETGRTMPLRESVLALVDTLRPTAADLGCADELGGILTVLESGASYARQRAVIAAGGDLTDVVRSLRREHAADRPGA